MLEIWATRSRVSVQLKKKISWPAYKALMITVGIIALSIIPLAIFGVCFLLYQAGQWFVYLTE